MLAITAKCKCLCDSLTLSHYIHLRQLLFIELVEGQLDGTDGVEQIAIALQTGLGGDGCALCTDLIFVSQKIFCCRKITRQN